MACIWFSGKVPVKQKWTHFRRTSLMSEQGKFWQILEKLTLVHCKCTAVSSFVRCCKQKLFYFDAPLLVGSGNILILSFLFVFTFRILHSRHISTKDLHLKKPFSINPGKRHLFGGNVVAIFFLRYSLKFWEFQHSPIILKSCVKSTIVRKKRHVVFYP